MFCNLTTMNPSTNLNLTPKDKWKKKQGKTQVEI